MKVFFVKQVNILFAIKLCIFITLIFIQQLIQHAVIIHARMVVCAIQMELRIHAGVQADSQELIVKQVNIQI